MFWKWNRWTDLEIPYNLNEGSQKVGESLLAPEYHLDTHILYARLSPKSAFLFLRSRRPAYAKATAGREITTSGHSNICARYAVSRNRKGCILDRRRKLGPISQVHISLVVIWIGRGQCSRRLTKSTIFQISNYSSLPMRKDRERDSYRWQEILLSVNPSSSRCKSGLRRARLVLLRVKLRRMRRSEWWDSMLNRESPPRGLLHDSTESW